MSNLAALLNVGAFLKILRKKKGISVANLAKESGVQPVTIYKIEEGRHYPDLATLAKLTDAMNIPLSVFFGGLQC